MVGGNTVDCTTEMDDPRLTGEADIDLFWWCGGESVGPCVYWGRQRIDGPDGSWTGTLTDSHVTALLPPWPSGPSMAGIVVLEGDAGYDGLTFVGHLVADMMERSTLEGAIYEGPPPPMPGARLNPTFEDIVAGRGHLPGIDADE